MAIFTYLLLARFIFTRDQQAGLFLDTAIHDTTQIVGAGAMYHDQYAADVAMNTAFTVMLVRNLSMSLLIPLLPVLYPPQAAHVNAMGSESKQATDLRRKWHQVVPLFVIWFAAMACLRSIGDRWVR